jgi:hypothetical protein
MISFGFVTCVNSPQSISESAGKTTNNYFDITEPSGNSDVILYYFTTIKWQISSSTDSNDKIKITLFEGETYLKTIIASTENTGYYQYVFMNIPSGDKYRIQISLTADSSKYDFSAYFSIRSGRNGGIKINQPAQDAITMLDSSLTIKWDIIGDPGPRLKLNLCNDTQVIDSIATSAQTSLKQYTWKKVSSLLGSGVKYRIKAASTSDEAIFSFSDMFTIASLYNGSYKVLFPVDSLTFDGGDTVKIQWEKSGNLGPNTKLLLYRDTIFFKPINIKVPDSGYYNWTIPRNIPSGDNYYIRISNLSDEAIKASSKLFTINNIDKDLFEPDNNYDLSKVLLLDSLQNRTIHLGDTDIVVLSGISGKEYLITINGNNKFPFTMNFYDDSSSLNIYNCSSTSSSIVYLWKCIKPGNHYVKVFSTRDDYTGTYSIKMIQFDPYNQIVFKQPLQDVDYNVGSELNIMWTDVSGRLGKQVSIMLQKKGKPFVLVTSLPIQNSGECKYTLPAGLASGNDYQIRIESHDNKPYYGLSEKFEIKGVIPDTFECDDSRDLASLLPIAIYQNRSLTFNDTDWVTFTVDSGASYYILMQKEASIIDLSLYHDHSNSVGAFFSTPAKEKVIWVWQCNSRGKWYGKFTSKNQSENCNYSVKIVKHDPDMLIFNNPTTSTNQLSNTEMVVSWKPDSTIFGDSVMLLLYKNNDFWKSITNTPIPNSGTCTWLVPQTLMPGQYQIKISNASNTKISYLSEKFKIIDQLPDSFELDNTASNASVITIDTKQKHTLPVNDTDWIKIDLEIGKTYLFLVRGYNGLKTRMALFDDRLNTMRTSQESNNDNVCGLVYTCNKSNVIYARITPGKEISNGFYEFTVTPFDTLNSINYSKPGIADIYNHDSIATFNWEPDTIVFGTKINIILCQNDSALFTIKYDLKNIGTYSGKIPYPVLTDTNYRIKITSLKFPEICGYSKPFKINSIEVDSFENNNVWTSANAINLGTVYKHTISCNDVDFMSCLIQPNKIYVVRVIGDKGFKTSIAGYTFQNSFFNLDGNRPYFQENADDSGFFIHGTYTETYATFAYFEIKPWNSLEIGRYSFSCDLFDSLSSLEFVYPTKNNIVTAGMQITMKWVYNTDIFGNTINIDLFKGQVKVLAIAINIPYNNQFVYSIPSTIVNGDDYQIRISNASYSKTCGYSQPFSIISK